jgi:hypothetical protein
MESGNWRRWPPCAMGYGQALVPNDAPCCYEFGRFCTELLRVRSE